MNGSAVALSSREAHGTAAQHPVISVCGHAASLPTCYVDGTAVDSTSRPVHGAAAHLPARPVCGPDVRHVSLARERTPLVPHSFLAPVRGPNAECYPPYPFFYARTTPPSCYSPVPLLLIWQI